MRRGAKVIELMNEEERINEGGIFEINKQRQRNFWGGKGQNLKKL